MSEVGEVLKSGAMADLTALVKQLVGPTFTELGLMLGENMKVVRMRNLLKTTEKTKRILEAADVTPKAVPTRLLLPIIDSCSVEDDEDLQQKWAGLLASASQEGNSTSPSFSETLRQLTPAEAKHLDLVFSEASMYSKGFPVKFSSLPYYSLITRGGAPEGALDTYERLGLIRRDYAVKIDNGTWKRKVYELEDAPTYLSDVQEAFGAMEAEVEWEFRFTDYALKFFAACRGPQPKS